jgi:hypothetical protein
MGIIYQITIRCFLVFDKTKVNCNPIYEKDYYDSSVKFEETWEKRLSDYYTASKANLQKILGVYKHDPCCRSGYSITNLLIPSQTDVLAVSNNACDRRGTTVYEFLFYNIYGHEIGFKKVSVQCEENRFMIIVPEDAHTFRCGIYNEADGRQDGYDQIHFFDHGRLCQTCENCSCCAEKISTSSFETD